MRFLLLLIALCLAATPALAWSPPEADFTVELPSDPSAQAAPPKRMSDIGHRRYVVQEPTRAMVVAVEEYPEGDRLPAPNAAVYERILQGHAENNGTELVSTRASRLAGRPSLEGVFADPRGDVEIVRVLLSGRRIYRLTYAYAADSESRGGAEAFFASFRVAAP